MTRLKTTTATARRGWTMRGRSNPLPWVDGEAIVEKATDGGEVPWRACKNSSWIYARASKSANMGVGREERTAMENASKGDPRPQRNLWSWSSKSNRWPIADKWSHNPLKWWPYWAIDFEPLRDWRSWSRRLWTRLIKELWNIASKATHISRVVERPTITETASSNKDECKRMMVFLLS